MTFKQAEKKLERVRKGVAKLAEEFPEDAKGYDKDTIKISGVIASLEWFNRAHANLQAALKSVRAEEVHAIVSTFVKERAR